MKMKAPRLLVLLLALGGCLDPNESGNLVPKTVDEDLRLPAIEVAGTKLHAEAFGDPAAPIVMALHGGPGTDYRAMLPLKALADDGYRVVFWDQRGAGLSKRHNPGDYSWNTYPGDLRLVIEHYTVTPGQPLVFIGHSWGAMYLTWFINENGDYGGRIRGAILSDPGAFTKVQLDAYMKRLMGSFELTGEQLNDITWSGQFLSSGDHARADYLRAMMSMGGAPSDHEDPANPTPFWRRGAIVSARFSELVNGGFDWTTNLKAFGHKVLFLRSDLDTAHRLEDQQEMATSYADAEIVTIPNTGHEMLWQRPEEYLAHTRDYFRAIGFIGGVR
jgi:proline iminopeptidase